MRARGEGERQNEMDGCMDMNLSKLWETVKDRNAWHAEFMVL